MRIASNMMTYNFISSLQNSASRLSKLQEQMSDGKIVHRPSDDPVRAFRGLRFGTSINMNEQYTQNLKDAMEWMNTSDSGVQSLDSLVVRAKELVINSISANTSSAQQAISSELDGIINQMVQVGNTQNGDRYVFAGQKDKMATEPFKRVTINVGAPPVPTEYVVYNGDFNKISMSIQTAAPDPAKDSINVTGEEVFGPLVQVTDAVTGVAYPTMQTFNDLLRIKEELVKTTPDLNWLSNTALAQIDKDHDRIILADTELGARMSNYTMLENMMAQNNTTIAENQSANDDLDVPRAVIDYKTSQNIYQMALSVGAKIMPPSLADFLN